jgi:tRNA-binding EMAP/Myf-like protein
MKHPDADGLYVEVGIFVRQREREADVLTANRLWRGDRPPYSRVRAGELHPDRADARSLPRRRGMSEGPCSRHTMGVLTCSQCNLKPANMRGVKSFAMVLCVSADAMVSLSIRANDRRRRRPRTARRPGSSSSSRPQTRSRVTACTSRDQHSSVCPLVLLTTSIVLTSYAAATALSQLNPKKKIFETIQPGPSSHACVDWTLTES